MNDKPKTKIEYVSPLKRICMTIGELPTAYIETMSYYEMLIWFVEFLKNKVIPTVDNNALAVQELQNLFVELQNYVNNYFDNLDVQEEINNKLDEMASDGTLQEIISDYLNSKAVFGFDNVEDMKSATNLIAGSYAETLGYYEKNDGGSALYLIRNITNQDVIDNGYLIPMNNENLVAELIIKNIINVKQFGAYGNDINNDTTAIQKAFNKANELKVPVYIPSGIYKISTLTGYAKMKLFGDNRETSIFKSIDNNDITSGLLTFDKNTINKIVIKSLGFNGNKTNNSNEFSGIYFYSDSHTLDCYALLEDLELYHFTKDGIHLDGPDFVEGRIINVRSLNNNKNGIYINNGTDSIIDNTTCCFNIECGIYLKGSNWRLSNTKCHTNGPGIFSNGPIDYERVPASAYEVTEDTAYNPNKIYFTRTGTQYPDDYYQFTQFEGNEFVPGITYYEMNKPYYKKYPGFYLRVNRSSITNCEAQDNSGDGFYLYGICNNLNVSSDANGRLTTEQQPFFSQISYASVGLEPLYDAVHVYYYGPNNIICSADNLRYPDVGYLTRYALCVEKANSRINALINYNASNVYRSFNSYNANNRNFDISVNGKKWILNYDLNRLTINENYTLNDRSYAKANGNVIEILLILQKTGGIGTNMSGDDEIFTLPTILRPNENQFCLSALTNNAGFSVLGICSCNITSNGKVLLRNVSSQNANQVVAKFNYVVSNNNS